MARRPPQYRGKHDAVRARLRVLIDSGGVLCSRCGKPIMPGAKFHADHVEGTVDQYRGAAHPRCNERAAAVATNAKRKADRAPVLQPRSWSRHWLGVEYDVRCPECHRLGHVCDEARVWAEREGAA